MIAKNFDVGTIHIAQAKRIGKSQNEMLLLKIFFYLMLCTVSEN